MATQHDSELINTLDFVDQRERLYFAKAQLGEQVRAFLVSPVGRYLHGCAREEADAARTDAIDIHPWSPFTRRKLAKARERAAHARHFMAWCVDAINEGEMSATQLDDYRQGI